MRRAAVASLVALAAACAHGGRREAPGGERGEARKEVRHHTASGAEVGIASFYAERFNGRRTASGARYDMNAFTCAHPSAPFGARLRVTEIESGRTVVVTVNDRGPFAHGRVVDLSLAAARALRIVERGLAKVRIERLAD
ncbi:MAG TPA: septal ring lytic transglycosylase RlpA family protein [Anaeromyxobacter sp.]